MQPFCRRSKFSVFPLQLAGNAETWKHPASLPGQLQLFGLFIANVSSLPCLMALYSFGCKWAAFACWKCAWHQIIGWDSFAPSVMLCGSCDRLCDVLPLWSIWTATPKFWSACYEGSLSSPAIFNNVGWRNATLNASQFALFCWTYLRIFPSAI